MPRTVSDSGGRGGDRRIILVLTIMAIASTLALIGIFDPRGQMRPWHALFGPKEDGDWAAESIDGRKVSPIEFRVAVFNRKVVGGRDGCNDWAYTREPGPSGERMIDSTMVYCVENEPGRILRLLAYAPNIQRLPSGKLKLSARGHQAVFRRCRWKNVKQSGQGWNSEIRQCLVEPAPA